MTILGSSVLCTGHNILLPRILICHDSHVYIILGPTHNYYYYYLREGFKFFFFWRESFNLWHLLLIIALYHQTKTPISFQCKQRMNPRSLIQLSEILPVELTGTHRRLQLNQLNIVIIFSRLNYDSQSSCLSWLQISDLLSNMQKNWPSLACPSSNSIQFWTHEWEKHGTCSESILSQHGYFDTALTLKGKTNLLKALTSAGKFNFQYFSVLFFK